MKSRIQAATTLVALLASVTLAQAGTWSTRVAATWLQTTDGSTNSAVPVKVEDKLMPEIDISYAFNDHWSADLILSVPQEHKVKSGGTALGTFKHLPPTLLAKYTFNPTGSFRPYLGAGANFTLIFDDDLYVGGTRLKLENYSVGPAAQAGFDYALSEKWALNFDVKRIMIRTDVEAGGVKLTEARLDPWLYSLGLRYAF